MFENEAVCLTSMTTQSPPLPICYVLMLHVVLQKFHSQTLQSTPARCIAAVSQVSPSAPLNLADTWSSVFFYHYLIYYKTDLQSRLTILQYFWKSSMLIVETDLPFSCKLGNINRRARNERVYKTQKAIKKKTRLAKGVH